MSAETARIEIARTHLRAARDISARRYGGKESAEAILNTIEHTLNALDAITARFEQHLVGGSADHPELRR